MKFEELVTKRLKLRKLSPEVIKYVFENLSTDDLKKFFCFNNEEELNKEKEKLEKGLSTFNRTFLYFQLIDRLSNDVIGWCGYHTWYIDHDRAEIGYVLTNENYKRKGIMSEAIKPIIKYGFHQMKLNRIEALVSPNNIASLNIIKKQNFVQEGYLKQHYKINNKLEDSLFFALLKSEYKK